MIIQKMKATITGFTDLSESAREIVLHLPTPLPFVAGAFVNVFFTVDGERVRRAYSISSDSSDTNNITLSIRKTPNGAAGKFFWNNDVVGSEIEIQGPLGLNTADKFRHKKIFLFGFGIGVSVIKALLHHLVSDVSVQNITIVTGSRDENNVLYKEFFENASKQFPHVSFLYTISQPSHHTPKENTGYIQEHIADMNFNSSDVYVCGQEQACNDLVEKIRATQPADCAFFVEGFH